MLLIERKEEEIGGYPFARNAWGLARVGAGAVAHRAIALHFTDAGTRAVAHRTIAVKPTDARSGTIADSAIPVNLADT